MDETRVVGRHKRTDRRFPRSRIVTAAAVLLIGAAGVTTFSRCSDSTDTVAVKNVEPTTNQAVTPSSEPPASELPSPTSASPATSVPTASTSLTATGSPRTTHRTTTQSSTRTAGTTSHAKRSSTATTAWTLPAAPPSRQYDNPSQRTLSDDAAYSRRDTWIIGDSITVQTYQDLVSRLQQKGTTLAVDATSGITTMLGVDRLYWNVKKFGPPATLVIALGTNDTRSTDPGQFVATDIRRARSYVGPTTRIVYVNVYARWSDQGVEQSLAASRTINAAVKATGEVSRIADWYTFLSTDSRYATYLTDGVHVNNDGVTQRDNLIIAQLSAR